MKFSKEDIEYLNGNKFSNGRKFKVAGKNNVNFSRLDFLESYAKDKNVLHIGFTDHIPLIKEKIGKNQWLHTRLVQKAKNCYGIDIDADAVEYVKSEISIDNVFCFDITKDNIPTEISDKKWDVIIIGEVLEHIDNPVEFLSQIHLKFSKIAGELIVTVPNALELINIKLIRKGQEFINTDHRYWFTPYTLSKVLFNSGFLSKEVFYSQTFQPSRFYERYLVNKFPMLRETVISISTFR
ncbi:class I SAM-dependent methyltransferase [Balneola sp. MJW-20]|uniref:class I SAM-dependent methyltransferase n=1 Tax=Gracilimonas aurantiaca TaxID=3234185 RepID=UPI003466FD25